MKQKIIISLIITLTLCLTHISIAAAQPHVYDVCISSSTPGNYVSKLEGFIASLLTQEMEAGDLFIITESANKEASVRILFTEKFTKGSKKIPVFLKKYFEPEMGQLKTLFEKLEKNAKDSFQELNYPFYFDIVANRLRQSSEYDYHVILLGSPLHFEDGFFTQENRYFSDGYLLSESSPYNVRHKSGNLNGVKVHLIYDGSKDWFSSYDPVGHKEKTKRYLALMVSQQGGQLVTFGTELALLKNIDSLKAPSQKWSINEKDLRPLVHIFQPPNIEEVATKLWDDVASSKTPPSETTGTLTVGLKWQENVDLDIYVANSTDELSYKTPESPSGVHIKDYRQAPPGSLGYETVVFHEKQDLKNIKIFVNHFSGAPSKTPVKAQVRVLFNNSVYFKDILLYSKQGNEGAMVNNNRTGGSWQELDILTIVGLK